MAQVKSTMSLSTLSLPEVLNGAVLAAGPWPIVIGTSTANERHDQDQVQPDTEAFIFGKRGIVGIAV